MSPSLETCRRRRIRIPLLHRWGDQIKWEEMRGTYGTWHMAHGTCEEDEKCLEEFDMET